MLTITIMTKAIMPNLSMRREINLDQPATAKQTTIPTASPIAPAREKVSTSAAMPETNTVRSSIRSRLVRATAR